MPRLPPRILRILACAALLATGGCATRGPDASDAAAARQWVEQATATLTDFAGGSEHPEVHAALRTACAVLVFPRVASLSFLVGGSGGVGVLLVRDPATGLFHGPAFYSISEADVGPQVGMAERELIVAMRECDALAPLYRGESSLRLGTSLAAQAAERGKGLEVSPSVRAFSRVQGIYVGAAFEATVLRARPELTSAFFGRPLSPAQLLAPGAPDEPQSRAIRSALAFASR